MPTDKFSGKSGNNGKTRMNRRFPALQTGLVIGKSGNAVVDDPYQHYQLPMRLVMLETLMDKGPYQHYQHYQGKTAVRMQNRGRP